MICSVNVMKRVGWMFARFVALAVAMFGAWLFIANVTELDYSGGVLAWILVSGALGAFGGSLFLLSIDGPERFRRRGLRVLGWLGMLACVILPTALSILMLPLVVVLLPTLFMRASGADEQAITSA